MEGHFTLEVDLVGMLLFVVNNLGSVSVRQSESANCLNSHGTWLDLTVIDTKIACCKIFSKT